MDNQKRIELTRRVLSTRGIDVMECTAAEWFKLALEAEDTVRAMSPFDPFRVKFIKDQTDYMDAATIREQLGDA